MAETPQWKQVEPYQKDTSARRPNVVAGQRVPKLPFENYISEAGHLIRLAVGSTRNFAGAREAGGDPLRTMMWNRMRAIREGKIPWDYGHDKKGGYGAKMYTPWLVGNMTEDEWNVWREKELVRRRTAYEAESNERGKAWREAENRQVRDAVAQVMAGIVDAAKAEPRSPEALAEAQATLAGKNVFAKRKGDG